MALVVNADDFGMNESVTSAITEAFERGLIDRTTMMVNMPYAKEAMKIAVEKGFADKVGLHLNLTSGRPLTPGIAKDRIMCDENGEFTADFARNIKTRFHLPAATQKNVRDEIHAQLEQYGKLGGTLWHIDSHHYVHTDPSIWSILKKELSGVPVTSVRLGRNMYRGGNPLLHLYKYFLNRSILRFDRLGETYFGSAVDYADFFAKMSPDTERYGVEIMVHPVYDDNGKLVDAYMGKHYELKRLH